MSITPTHRFFKILQLIGIFGISLLLLNFGYQMWRVHQRNTVLKSVINCDVQQSSCTRQLPQGQTITIDMLPHPMLANSTVSVTIALSNAAPDSVGIIVFPIPLQTAQTPPTILKPMPDGHRYVAQVTIGAPGKWIAMVMLKKGTEQITVPFRFVVK